MTDSCERAITGGGIKERLDQIVQPRKPQAGLAPSDTEPLLATKLKTLLQVGRAFEVAYGLDAKPADVGSIEAALSR